MQTHTQRTHQTYISHPVQITAVQWRGDNLSEVQRLLAPSSPLLDSSSSGTRHLGINVKGALQFADRSMWVVKHGEHDFELVHDAQFRARYTQAQETANTGATGAGDNDKLLGRTPITATHPRALVDRQPAEGERAEGDVDVDEIAAIVDGDPTGVVAVPPQTL